MAEPSLHEPIEFKNLSKHYYEGGKKQDILVGVNQKFQAGQFIVILGKSGSGKSTLLNLLSGVDLPSEGQIHVGNTELTALSEKRRTLFRRNHMGIVFQFFNLIPTLNVLENVTLCQELNGWERKQAKEQAIVVLEKVGLAQRLQAFPDRLSGGEQQRVAIARALAHDPHIIIADEPTGNLDLETGQMLLEMFISLIKQAGKTLFMATHSAEAAALADKIYTIREGKLTTHEE